MTFVLGHNDGLMTTVYRNFRFPVRVIFNRRLIRPGSTWRFSVETDPRGWRATEEDNGCITKEIWSANWRRIEGQMTLFDVRAQDLRGRGWHEVSESQS